VRPGGPESFPPPLLAGGGTTVEWLAASWFCQGPCGDMVKVVNSHA
jgi:hypothetical protein